MTASADVPVPRRGPKLEPLLLSADERAVLERWARRASSAQAVALRARVVLACAGAHVDLLTIEVDMEVVPGEALVAVMLMRRVALQRPGDGDLVFTGSLFEVGQGCVAGVDQVLGGQQPATSQAGVDAGQDLAVVGGGRGGGDIRDHVGAVGSTGLGQMSGEPLPADDVPVPCVAGRGVVGRDDRPRRRRQTRPAFLLGGAPAKVPSSITVIVLHHDLPQSLNTRTGHAVRSVPVEVFQEPDGVVSGGKDPGHGLGGVLAQADRSAVASPPVLIDQLVQQVRGDDGDLLQ
ncbi:hypothetical protein [Streptomyces sp. NPDC056987]|uniref:hypothetical protein n=1 Tax=Streptomyces sp. NPDC056987 TaxID=3345988 RepID=UPI00362AAB84